VDATTRQAQERRDFADFATRHSEQCHRPVLDSLYAVYRRFNPEFCGGRLTEAHIYLGRTAPRSLSHCSAYAGHGAAWEITVNRGLTLEPNPEWVLRPWPAYGLVRFVHGLVWKQAARQYVLEVEGAQESGYEGFGPRFCEFVNRINVRMGWRQVIPRRRGAADADEPLGRGWPHNVELLADPHAYEEAVTAALIDLATGSRTALRSMPAPPRLGLLELLLYQINGNKVERARELLVRHIDRLQGERLRKRPRNSRAERGETDVDGSPLGQVDFDPGWLHWANGTVRKIAEAIDAWRAFGELPILADALEEAGCCDGRILRHLRERMEHTRQCWCMRRRLEGPKSQAP
jgi:hypothetical protein